MRFQSQAARAMTLTLVATTALVLAGCSSKRDATTSNFSAALDRYLQTDGDLCLGVGVFPVDVDEADLKVQATVPEGIAAQMAALQRAGLLSSVDVVLGQLEFTNQHLTGHQAHVRRYSLTTAGRDAYRKIVADRLAATDKPEPERGDLCYGKLAVKSVIDWDGPTDVDGRREAAVHYTYSVEKLADWAKAPEMMRAYPTLRNTIDGAGKDKLSTTLVLGKDGWEPRRP